MCEAENRSAAQSEGNSARILGLWEHGERKREHGDNLQTEPRAAELSSAAPGLCEAPGCSRCCHLLGAGSGAVLGGPEGFPSSSSKAFPLKRSLAELWGLVVPKPGAFLGKHRIN